MIKKASIRADEKQVFLEKKQKVPRHEIKLKTVVNEKFHVNKIDKLKIAFD